MHWGQYWGSKVKCNMIWFLVSSKLQFSGDARRGMWAELLKKHEQGSVGEKKDMFTSLGYSKKNCLEGAEI